MVQVTADLLGEQRAGDAPSAGRLNTTQLTIASTAPLYRPITSASDMPECFSRPICRFALRLNDEASDLQRQQLLPFVTRLACADTPEVERQREGYIAFHSRNRHTFLQRLEVLERALAIGRQADPLGPEEVRTRLDEAKGRATTTSSVQTRTSPPSSRVGSLC